MPAKKEKSPPPEKKMSVPKGKKVVESSQTEVAPVKVAPVEVAPVEVAPVEVAPVSQNEVVSEIKTDDEIGQTFIDLTKKLQLLVSTLATLKQDFKSLEKRYHRDVKHLTKEKSKRKSSGKPRAPSGFVKPTVISSDLAIFLCKTDGTEMARTEVTREINKYIRANDLQDPTNGRKINPDTKLRNLLEVPVEEDLTYFNLQKYLSKHFPKQGAAAAATAAAAAAAAASVVTTSVN
jgi:chromatin remodeling complex protein RSC6